MLSGIFQMISLLDLISNSPRLVNHKSIQGSSVFPKAKPLQVSCPTQSIAQHLMRKLKQMTHCGMAHERRKQSKGMRNCKWNQISMFFSIVAFSFVFFLSFLSLFCFFSLYFELSSDSAKSKPNQTKWKINNNHWLLRMHMAKCVMSNRSTKGCVSANGTTSISFLNDNWANTCHN